MRAVDMVVKLADLVSNPSSGISWDEVKRDIRNYYGR